VAIDRSHEYLAGLTAAGISSSSSRTVSDELDPDATHAYFLSFLLDDGTDTLDVIVFGHDGDQLLGVPASDFEANTNSAKDAGDVIKALSAPDAWVDCIVKAYYAEQGDQESPCLRFRMCATVALAL
jgi:hypothetical protein